VTELNMLLARFYLSVRTKLNREYEPDSLKIIQSSISRYLNEKRNINILKDKEFQHSRDVIDAKRKELKGKGLGNKKNRSDPFTSEDIYSLYRQNLLGTGKLYCFFLYKTHFYHYVIIHYILNAEINVFT
jgi:hypothetical protein